VERYAARGKRKSLRTLKTKRLARIPGEAS
jgi:hypothetical protein